MSLPKEALELEGDEVRLAQVFHNLLTNAAQYTPPNGRIRLHADLDIEKGGVRLTVSDNGVGIASDMIDHIWEPFVQADQASDRAEGGLGIGLTLVKRWVELHHGTVSVRSEGVGAGSTFEVWLPLPSADSVRPAAPDVLRGTRPESAPRRILIVDDNRDAAETLGEFLEGVGHQVGLAYDGPAGLALGTQLKPDVAILDIGLPVMDGYELAQQLRAALGDWPMRIIAVTGYGQEGDRVASQKAGFAHHVVKPVDLDELLRLIAPDETAT
jgi:CheY-like chemotaxis protein